MKTKTIYQIQIKYRQLWLNAQYYTNLDSAISVKKIGLNNGKKLRILKIISTEEILK